ISSAISASFAANSSSACERRHHGPCSLRDNPLSVPLSCAYVSSPVSVAVGAGRVFSRRSASSSKHVLQSPFALRGTEPQRMQDPSDGKSSSSSDEHIFHFSTMLPSAEP